MLQLQVTPLKYAPDDVVLLIRAVEPDNPEGVFGIRVVTRSSPSFSAPFAYPSAPLGTSLEYFPVLREMQQMAMMIFEAEMRGRD